MSDRRPTAAAASDPHPLEPDIFDQIAATEIHRGPLVICDVDEVVLHFIEPLEAYFERKGFELVAPVFRLNGNIRSRTTGELAEAEQVRALIYGFFEEDTEIQRPVANAAKILKALAGHAQIVMLTNMPGRFREARLKTLGRHDIPYPVLTNTGPKGPAVARLAELSGGPVFFLDDSEANVTSVREAVPQAHVIRFIADTRFFALVEPLEGIHHLSNCWLDTHRYIAAALDMRPEAETA